MSNLKTLLKECSDAAKPPKGKESAKKPPEPKKPPVPKKPLGTTNLVETNEQLETKKAVVTKRAVETKKVVEKKMAAETKMAPETKMAAGTKKAKEPKMPLATKLPSDTNKTNVDSKTTSNKEVKGTLKNLQVKKLTSRPKERSFIGQRLRSKANPNDDDGNPPSVDPPKATGAKLKKKLDDQAIASALGDDTVEVKKPGRKRKNSPEVQSTVHSSKFPVIDVPEKKTTSKKEPKTHKSKIINESSELNSQDRKEDTKAKKHVQRAKTAARPTGLDFSEEEEPKEKAPYQTDMNITKVIKSRSRKKPDTTANNTVVEASASEMKLSEEKKKKTNKRQEGKFDVLTGEPSMQSVSHEPIISGSVTQVRGKKNNKTGALEKSDKLKEQAVGKEQSTALTKNAKSKKADLCEGTNNLDETTVASRAKPNSKKTQEVSKQNGEASTNNEVLQRMPALQLQAEPDFNINEDANMTYEFDKSVDILDQDIGDTSSLDSTFTTPNSKIMATLEKRGQLFRGPKGEYVINSENYRLSIVTNDKSRQLKRLDLTSTMSRILSEDDEYCP